MKTKTKTYQPSILYLFFFLKSFIYETKGKCFKSVKLTEFVASSSNLKETQTEGKLFLWKEENRKEGRTIRNFLLLFSSLFLSEFYHSF